LTAKIKNIEIVVLSFPASHYISGWRPITKVLSFVTFLFTDIGVVGIGEGRIWTSIFKALKNILSLAKLIKGLSLEDALDVLVTREREEFNKNKHVDYGAYLALESAILHALSQCRKVQYEAELLGGVYREVIPITYTIFLNHPKYMAYELEYAVKSGFKHIKLKIPCSIEELERLLKTLHSVIIQYNAQDLVLRVDVNQCFSTLERARRALSIMEKYNIKIVEQPMPQDKLKEIAKLRREFHPAIEIMLDESLRKPSDIELFAQMEVAGIINFHPPKLGCLTITREAILKTQELGMKANIGSSFMTEVGLSHYLNLAASIPKLDYPLEELGLFNIYGYSITLNPLEINGDSITLRNVNVVDLDFNMMKRFLVKNILSLWSNYRC